MNDHADHTQSTVPTPHSNIDTFERAKQAAHAPKDSASSKSKLIALGLMAFVSLILVVAGALIDGIIGAIIGVVLSVGIIGIGGTAVWMADASHRKETRLRQEAARKRAARKRAQQAADAPPSDADDPTHAHA